MVAPVMAPGLNQEPDDSPPSLLYSTPMPATRTARQANKPGKIPAWRCANIQTAISCAFFGSRISPKTTAQYRQSSMACNKKLNFLNNFLKILIIY
jgi:hypothetical protein